jgi:hypothetical protein
MDFCKFNSNASDITFDVDTLHISHTCLFTGVYPVVSRGNLRMGCTFEMEHHCFSWPVCAKWWGEIPPGRINSLFLMGVSLILEEESFLSYPRILQFGFLSCGKLLQSRAALAIIEIVSMR